MMNPWLGMAVVLAALGIILGGLRLYQKWGMPHPELLRKILHVGMGLVAVAFPWLFDRAWPVLVLGVLSIGTMIALRVVKQLAGGMGTVVSGVQRVSLGEFYFPVAIAIQWYLYQYEERPSEIRIILYCVPLLLLTLADAVAALVGVHYGRWRYFTADGWKSIEGSFAFFMCAFQCVQVPLLLHTNTGRAETLLIAVLLALVATMIEAISWAGLDNLVLPLVAHLLLEIYLGLSVVELETRLVVTAVLMVFVLVYRTRTTLQGGALLGTCLVGYITWALGDWRWLLSPLIVFLAYTLLSPRTEGNSQRVHNIHEVIGVTAAGLIWLFLSRLLIRPEFRYLFTLAFAAELAIIGVIRRTYDHPQQSALAMLTLSILQGWALLFVPYLVVEWSEPLCLRCVLGALPGVAVAAVGFYITQPWAVDFAADSSRWLRQVGHGVIGSSMGLVPLYFVG